MRVPSLRLHARGVWFCRFGGRDHYFTRDRAESQALYLELLDRRWVPYASARQRSMPADKVTIVEASELYLADVLTNLGKRRMGAYRNYLAEFIRAWGALPLKNLNAQMLGAMKSDLAAAGRAPRTVNHAIKAVRRMYSFAADHFQMERRADLSKVKLLKVPRPVPKAPQLAGVVGLIMAATEPGHPRSAGWKATNRYPQAPRPPDPRLRPWLALNYLACLRPSELVRLVHGHGQWIHRGVFEMTSKVQKSDGENYRYVVLSEEALGWLSLAAPAWRTWEAYSKALRDIVGPGGPRRLRSWGATHLRRAGISRAEIGAVLGHEQDGSLRNYVEEDWVQLRRVASRLTLRPALQATPSTPPAVGAGEDDEEAWSPS